jgi:hypothetical protein
VPQHRHENVPTVPESTGEAIRLDEADAAFIQSSVSILVAAEGPGRRPVMARAVSVLVDAVSGRVRLCLRTDDAAALIAGAGANGRVAAMFSRPQTNDTIQLKGDRVAIEAPTPADEAARRRYVPQMVAELMPLGFEPAFIGCVMSDHGSPIAVLAFTPTALFDQTPGPQAGRRRAAGEKAR